jgi:TP901-1 family phage major tail protein
LKIGNGVSPQTFSTLGGIRSRTISINNDSVDITDSDNAPWRQLMSDTGLRSVSLSGSGVFKDEAAINTVENLAFSGLIEEFQVVFGNGDIIQGLFQVTSFEYAGEHTSEQTYSVSMESAGIATLMRA